MNRRIVQVIGGCDFIATVSVNLVLKMGTDGVVFNRISTMDNGIAICSSLNRSVRTNRNGSMFAVVQLNRTRFTDGCNK